MPKTNVPETITWKAAAHFEHQRSSSWYLSLTIVALALLGFAIFYDKNIITVITFALIILVIFLLSIQPSRHTTYKITTSGIAVGRTLYPYQAIKYFYIVYNPPEVKTLNFETTAYINNKIILQLGNQDPVEVKLVLNQYLPEDLDGKESVTEVLARKLKI